MVKIEVAKILVVDDEKKIREVIRSYLEREDYFVCEAEDGYEALEMLKLEDFQLVILDLMLPGVDGWTICREIRRASDTPIIMTTARGEEYDRIFGLEIGADDYVVKPFSPRELVARVKALLRRSMSQQSNEDKSIIKAGAIKIDYAARKVIVIDEQVSLTPKEFDLLFFLVKNKGKVFSREKLLEQIWGYEFFGELRTVDTHIKKIREKIRSVEPDADECITTVWGIGYKIND